MATIDVHIDAARDLTIFTVTGELTAEDILRHAQAYYVEHPTQLVLWDASAGSVMGISTDDFRTIARRMQDLSINRRNGKTAFLSTEIDFGLGRMFESLAHVNNVPIDYRTFRDRQEALRWLGVADNLPTACPAAAGPIVPGTTSPTP